MRTTVSASLFVAVSVAAGVTAVAAPAYASVQWNQDTSLPGYSSGGPGCGIYIAVGPNDVPWVIGCGGSAANDYPYFLQYKSCGGNCFGGTYTWVRANDVDGYPFPALQISIDQNNAPFLTGIDGTVWRQRAGTSLPNIFEGNYAEPGVLATGAVHDTLSNTFWNLGFSITAYDQGMAQATNNPVYEGRTLADTQDNYTASKIVLFTGNIFGQQYQAPVIYNGGQIAFWNSNTQRFVPQQTPFLFDVTDHFIVVLQNNGTEIYQYGDLTGWSDYGSGLTPNGTWITSIAASNLHPSQLWGLDTNGHIFVSSAKITPK